MYKNILVATDGSSQSKIATEYAAITAEKWGAQLTILSVASPPLPVYTEASGLSTNYCVDYEKAIMSYHLSVLENAKKTVKMAHPRVKIVTQVKKGNTVSKILEASNAEDVDLVVIGNVGLGGIKDELGSVSTKVVTKCTKQVLVAK